MLFALRRHPLRYLLFLSVRWRRRAIFLLGGIAVGGAAVAFAELADLAQRGFQRLLAVSPYAPLVTMPASFAALVLITNRVFPNSQGSGIPQAIAARQLTDQAARGGLVSARIAVGKVLLTLLGLLCGASVGREGPSVQVGASIMFLVGRLSPSRQPGLILAGAAAGVAAAFNTPLAGIVFGIEEMSRSFEVRASGLIIGGVIAAGLTSLTLLGNYTYFGTTTAALHSGIDWLAVPVCGVVGGALGGVFSRILVEVGRGLPGAVGRWIKRYPVAFAAICGALTALAGLASGSTTYGTGYEQVSGLLDGSRSMPESFAILKMAATTFSSISGLPGGIFSPSLAVGGGLGANIAPFFPGTPLGALILLGMVSYFTGVVQAPITAFVIVTEMTNNHALLVPLMLASVIAYSTSRLICPTGVYHALAENFLRQAAPDTDGSRTNV